MQARQGLRRVFRPRMLGIAPAHVFAHVQITAAPKTRQIHCGLQRPPSGREQRDFKRVSRNIRMAGLPKHFLQPHGNFRNP